MSYTRLIERWLPITEIGIESLRERTPMTPFPAPNRLHVWWARRPLVASRAAILASLLPADADRDRFKHLLGIHGNPIESRRNILNSRRSGVRFEGEAYSYERAFKYCPNEEDRKWLSQQVKSELSNLSFLDPTAGGGAIPLEATRLGLTTFANDLNPVASLIEKCTIEWPEKFGQQLLAEYRDLSDKFIERREKRLIRFFPQEPEPNCIPTNYLWARAVTCPYCSGLVPLSPNWRLSPTGTGVRLLPQCGKGPHDPTRRCDFEIVHTVPEQSQGTVADGDANCPFPDCGRVISNVELKEQGNNGQIGDQLYTVVFKRRVKRPTKTGRMREKWERGYRPPRKEDDISAGVNEYLAEKLPEWESLDLVPNELLPMNSESWTHGNTPAQYGAKSFRDLFAPRQLLSHLINLEVFNEMLKEARSTNPLTELSKASFCYLALSLDRLLDYNSRCSIWISLREVMGHTFTQHHFAFKWTFAEISPLIQGIGYDWAIDQTADCIKELLAFLGLTGAKMDDFNSPGLFKSKWVAPPITVTCKSGDALDHIFDASIETVVMDPPYYDNVMYAELSDFFYVWLKRTAGQVLPELFRRPLTDKENEAVANTAKFGEEKRAKDLARRDYQDRMAAIFAECRRVLKPSGIMTLMFTHRATGAWDALTKALMEAGFTITASWPINTEAEGSLHIKNKAAANSTIFLACRPRTALPSDAETQYWEDVEPLVASAVRKRVAEFQAAGIRGVDLYLASFGPALEEFSKHWPLKRGTPNPPPPSRKRVQKELFPEEWDPYAVAPEDALNAARREVKSWRLEQLTHKRARTELDPRTSWFVLAWDAFQAPVFPYDEALRLARAVGVDLENDIVGSLASKKGSDLVMWDSVQRANKGALGSADGSSGMVDALHHAAYQGRTKTLESARELLERSRVIDNPDFRSAMQAILEVLPVGTTFSGVELPPDVVGAGNDFEAIEKLRRLAFADQVEEPQQLALWQS